MNLPIPPDLWQHLCFLLAQYANCQATLNAHEGQVCSMDIRIHLKAGQVPHIPGPRSEQPVLDKMDAAV